MTRVIRPTTAVRVTAVAAVTVLLLAISWVWVSSPAFAHTELVASDPPDGAILYEPPRSVTLTLSEVNGTTSLMTVYDPHGEPVSIDTPALVVPDSLRVPLAVLTKPGRYTTQYWITAEDGHLATGLLWFTLVNGTGRAGPAPVEPAAAAGAAREHESGPAWPWIVVGLVAVAAGAGALLLLKLRDVRL
jgi:copper resistance protein C